MQLNLDATTTTKGAVQPRPTRPGLRTTRPRRRCSDSLGNAHEVDVYFDKTASGQWDWHAMTDGGALQGGTAGTPTQIASGSMQFDTNGNLTNQTTASSSASFVGATPNQAINFDFTGTTQNAGASTVGSVTVDGSASGSLADITIGADGNVTGQFDNGEQTVVAQRATATFNNNNGLQQQGSGLWSVGATSGQPAYDVPGNGGRGSIQQGALEQSNVDLSDQLVTMIQYQRAFDSNSKTVTTADEMLQDVTNMTH